MIGLPIFILPQFIVCFLPLLRRLSGRDLKQEQIVKMSISANMLSILLLLYSFFYPATYEDIFLTKNLINALVLILFATPSLFWIFVLQKGKSIEESENMELFNILQLLSCLLLLSNQILLMVSLLPVLLIGFKLNEYKEKQRRLSMVTAVSILMSLCMIIAFFEFIRDGNFHFFSEMQKQAGNHFPRLGVAMLAISLTPFFLYPVSKLLGDENNNSNWTKEILFGLFPSITATCIFLKISLLSGIYIKPSLGFLNIENFFFLSLVLASIVCFFKFTQSKTLKKLFSLWFLISSIHFLCSWISGLGVSEAVGISTSMTWSISIISLGLLVFSSVIVFVCLQKMDLKASDSAASLQIQNKAEHLNTIGVFIFAIFFSMSFVSVCSLKFLANTFRVMLSSELDAQVVLYFTGQILVASLQACSSFYILHECLRGIEIKQLDKKMMSLKAKAGYVFVIIVLILLGIYPSPLYNYIQNVIIN